MDVPRKLGATPYGTTDALLPAMGRVHAAVLTALMMLGSAAIAEPIGNPFDPSTVTVPPGYTMTSHEVTEYARPHVDGIAHCYRKHVEPARELRGDMNVYLVIARTGRVVHAEVLASGVPLSRLSDLDRCVRREVTTWRFPKRAGFSNVTVSYFDLNTTHPATGARPREIPNV